MNRQRQDIDQLISGYLKSNMTKTKKSPLTANCPEESRLSDFLNKRLSREKEDSLLEHLAHCAHCLSQLELAQRAKEKAGLEPSWAMRNGAKNIAKLNYTNELLKYKWPVLSCFSFIFSFIFKAYFVQFLVLAVIFSFKWIFDTASTRTLIMIYQAWRNKDSDTAQRIIRDFQDKMNLRRR
ncbi:hypothetical protein ACFL1I_06715 [Candidatus Omnitrophota bacterium]